MDGSMKKIELLVRIDTENEIKYYKNGGILTVCTKKHGLILWMKK